MKLLSSSNEAKNLKKKNPSVCCYVTKHHKKIKVKMAGYCFSLKKFNSYLLSLQVTVQSYSAQTWDIK